MPYVPGVGRLQHAADGGQPLHVLLVHLALGVFLHLAQVAGGDAQRGDLQRVRHVFGKFEGADVYYW